MVVSAWISGGILDTVRFCSWLLLSVCGRRRSSGASVSRAHSGMLGMAAICAPPSPAVRVPGRPSTWRFPVQDERRLARPNLMARASIRLSFSPSVRISGRYEPSWRPSVNQASVSASPVPRDHDEEEESDTVAGGGWRVAGGGWRVDSGAHGHVH
jgi:hypothetical protein